MGAGVTKGESETGEGKDAEFELVGLAPGVEERKVPGVGGGREGEKGEDLEPGGEDRPAAEDDGNAAQPKKKGKKARAQQAGDNVELFNLASDPYEKKNLAAEQPEKLKDLRARYEALAKQAAPTHNKPAPANFKPPKVWGEPESTGPAN